MNKSLRFASMLVILMAITLLSLSGAAWAGPAQQGTVPTCDPVTEATQPPAGQVATLNVCTGMAIVPSGAFPTGGLATIEEKTRDDLEELGDLPPGLGFVGNGLDLSIFAADGTLVRFFSRSVTVCFPRNPDSRVVLIRQWDVRLQRWVPFPTFRMGELACTRTRLPGIYAPVGR